MPAAQRPLPIARAALLLASVLALYFGLHATITRKMPDFEVYWTAGVRARAAEPLYRAEDEHFQLKYLPGFAVLAIPAGLVPLQTAKSIWFGVSLALLVALIAGSVRALPERRRPAPALAAIALVAMGKFYGHELVLGQVNILFAVLVVCAALAMQARREATAGALVALAIVIKPYAVLLLPWLVARRRTEAVAAAIAGLTVVLLLPVPLYGATATAALHRDWWTTVTKSTAPNLLNQDNVSLAAMFAKWLEPGPVASVLAAGMALALLAAAGLVILRRRRVAAPDALDAALLLTLMPLVSPQGWDYVLLVATPAVVLLANYGDRLPRWLGAATLAGVAVTAFSLFDLMGRDAYAAFMSLSIVTVAYVIVVAALAVLRLRAVA